MSPVEAEEQEAAAVARAAVIGSDVFHYRDGSLPQGSVNYPKPPVTYVRTRKDQKGEAAWVNIDNPGGWHSYFYKAKFAKAKSGGQYTHHQLPSGCTPVLGKQQPGQKKEPVRVYKGWRFHYLGWKGKPNNKVDQGVDSVEEEEEEEEVEEDSEESEESGEESVESESNSESGEEPAEGSDDEDSDKESTGTVESVRDPSEVDTSDDDTSDDDSESDESDEQSYNYSRKHATRKDPFPKERKGQLDLQKLIDLGLTTDRLEARDALFFYQLLLPFCLT